jgi:hypothetical protein
MMPASVRIDSAQAAERQFTWLGIASFEKNKLQAKDAILARYRF